MGKPRAVFDANLYLNLLLSRDPDHSAVGLILRFAAEFVFDLLFAEDVVAELRDVVARRPYLASRISEEMLDAQFRRISEFAIPLPLLEQEPPRISRDAKDDYLVALAVLNAADYVVTRDKDLLDLEEVASVRIVDPVMFLSLLRSKKENSDAD
ncbi:MAG: putative toxin-antitoxin system toxin component, PIN family [Thermomicrobiales bacterium]